jgi:hypothetical protein
MIELLPLLKELDIIRVQARLYKINIHKNFKGYELKRSLRTVVNVARRRRWEDNIKRDLQEVGGDCGDWMERAQDRDRWRTLLNMVMNFRVP